MSQIVIISAVFPPEPMVTAQISASLAEELSKNHKITVLCPKPTRPLGVKYNIVKKRGNYKVIHVESYTCPQFSTLGRFRESYSFGKHCADYINNHSKDIDCIYLNSWPLFSQYFIVKHAQKYGIKTIVHVQDIYPESLSNKLSIAKGVLNGALLPIDRYILREATQIIAISDNMKDHLAATRRIDRSKIKVVANWQDEKDFIEYRENNKDKNKDNKDNPFTFMYLGNNGPLAGVDFLIKVFVEANIPNSRLFIAGGGSMTNWCKEYVKSLNADNIVFEPVPEGAVPRMQDQADVMLLPVKKGGAMSSIPSKLPAYMLSAKPIVGSLDLESDTAKAIHDSGCGIITKPESENELRIAMKDIIEWNDEKLKEKGRLGFEYAMQNFSKQANLNKIIQLIEDNISNGSKNNKGEE